MCQTLFGNKLINYSIKIKNASIDNLIVQYSILRKYQNLNGIVYFLSINPIFPCVVMKECFVVIRIGSNSVFEVCGLMATNKLLRKPAKD